MKRVAQIIGVKPGKLEEYSVLHDCIWPEVVTELKKAGIRNYSIFHLNGQLFAYYEYEGESFEEDMQSIGTSEIMKRWQSVCDTYQLPDPNRPTGTWWVDAKEVFHLD